MASRKGHSMQKLTHFQPDDVLTDVLRSVHVQGTLYCRSKMSVPWGFRVAHRDTASFHSEILFIQAMRAVTSTNNDGAIGWLKALHDPQIGQALAVIHSRPHEPWTVAALAAQVGLSRTAFTMKFKLLVGESPLRYLTRWRLNKAASYLRTSPGKLTEIARLVGYDSEVALSKAFKRYFGVAPGAYRHSLLAPRDGS